MTGAVYVFLVNTHWPTRPDAGISVHTISHPKGPSSFFTLRPIPWWLETLLHIHANAINPIQSHHESHTSRSTNAHPGSRKIHHLEFVGRYQRPALSVGHGYKHFPLPFHFVKLKVFPSSSVEDILVMHVSVCDCGCVAPHDIAEACRRPLIRSQAHGCLVSISMEHWQRRVYLVEVNISSIIALARDKGRTSMSYSSSIASCMGIGSSNPRPIISQEKFASRPRSRFSIICGSGIVFAAILSTACGSGLLSGTILEIGSVKAVSPTSGIDGRSPASNIAVCLDDGGAVAATPGWKFEEKSVLASAVKNEVFGSLDLVFLPSFVLLSWVSTWAERSKSLSTHDLPYGKDSRLTEPRLQIFDISSLRSTLPPNFIIRTVVSQACASRTLWSVPVAFEFPPSAYNASYALRFRRANVFVFSNSIVWTGRISGSRLWLPGKVVEVALVHAVWAVRHCDLYYINSVPTLHSISIKRVVCTRRVVYRTSCCGCP